jgi:hypothetical protein
VRPARELSRTAWARAIGIVLRTAHLGAMAVLVGAVVFAAPASVLHPWRAATAATGLALLLIEASHSRHWLYQGRGVLTLLHVASLVLFFAPAVSATAAVMGALGLGAIGSHLPRGLRKWSFRHRCVVD